MASLGLGPKWQVNASTGLFPYPFNSPAFTGSIVRRLQINVADINATTYACALATSSRVSTSAAMMRPLVTRTTTPRTAK